MKIKIVIKVPIQSEKAKSMALKIAVAVQGVSSVSIKKENDQLEVIGEGVDSVCLAKSLRKKFCFAVIESVEEVKPPKPDDKCPPLPCYYPPPYQCEYRPVYDSGPPNCTII